MLTHYFPPPAAGDDDAYRALAAEHFDGTMKWFNGIAEVPEEAIARLDEIGGPAATSTTRGGWAQCGNSPFKWYKQNTHEGGVHVPLVVHWPAGIAAAERGTMRHQFVNVSDVVPTVYELLGVAPPEVYKGLDNVNTARAEMARQ